jgi:hypothetical protein
MEQFIRSFLLRVVIAGGLPGGTMVARDPNGGGGVNFLAKGMMLLVELTLLASESLLVARRLFGMHGLARRLELKGVFEKKGEERLMSGCRVGAVCVCDKIK